MNFSKLQCAVKRIEQTIGGMKFAVILILLFTAFMIVGTFVESYHGADFAQRLIYKKWPFIAVQVLMFLSICYAAFLRLPPKKRLYGFYTIHSGLVVIAAGATITYIAGIDGSILLHPNEPNRRIVLNQDILRISFPEEGLQVTRDLPFTALPYNMGENYEGVEFVTYFPYSADRLEWRPNLRNFPENQSIHSSQYLLGNDQLSEEFTLSLHPEAFGFESSKTLGPLSIHYLPEALAPCFLGEAPLGLIAWNAREQTCFPLKERDIRKPAQVDPESFKFSFRGQELEFYPELSPWPLDNELRPMTQSEIRLFNLNLFMDRPHLFLFGRAVAYYDDHTQTWGGGELPELYSQVELPWMGLKVHLLHHEERLRPEMIPHYMRPIMESGSLVAGNQQALKVRVDGQEFWATDRRPLHLMIRGRRAMIEVGKKSLFLPFEFVLTEFVMDKDPGTRNPASFESYVRLFTGEGPKDHHIYMNNPLKYRGFTFYQASYSENADGSFSSTLSANVDQGRPFKYGGSLLVVLGSIWHYFLNKKRVRRKRED